MEIAVKQIKTFFEDYALLQSEYAQKAINLVGEYSFFTEQHISLKIKEGKKNLADIFAGVAYVHKRIDTENRKTSSLLNLLDFFDISENKMSELTAFLLNPKERHGQGDLYLRHFCNYFCRDEIAGFEPVHIRCEKSTDQQRRIDILVQVGDTYLIIENKFRGAADQENQLQHYYDYRGVRCY